jgi:hypothetical protein
VSENFRLDGARQLRSVKQNAQASEVENEGESNNAEPSANAADEQTQS